ncbi:iron transporter [Haladaptatus sp. NG-WS-4]
MSRNNELRPSDEVDESQLELARQAGDAYRQAAEYMITEVAETGAKTEVADYVVGFALEEAEGMYRMKDGRFEWKDPGESENCHLEVLVASSEDGRFLPGVSVRATLEDSEGNTVGPERIPFVWHPGLYHYGRNFALPNDGVYTITVSVEPPEFPRHDETNGDRFTGPVEVTFEDVHVETGTSS